MQSKLPPRVCLCQSRAGKLPREHQRRQQRTSGARGKSEATQAGAGPGTLRCVFNQPALSYLLQLFSKASKMLSPVCRSNEKFCWGLLVDAPCCFSESNYNPGGQADIVLYWCWGAKLYTREESAAYIVRFDPPGERPGDAVIKAPAKGGRQVRIVL